MWRELTAFLQTLFTLARDQKEARDEMKEIRKDLTKLTIAVAHLVNKIDLVQQEDDSEREKLAMQLQIELLKFEKQLPKLTTTKSSPKLKHPTDGSDPKQATQDVRSRITRKT